MAILNIARDSNNEVRVGARNPWEPKTQAVDCFNCSVFQLLSKSERVYKTVLKLAMMCGLKMVALAKNKQTWRLSSRWQRYSDFHLE